MRRFGFMLCFIILIACGGEVVAPTPQATEVVAVLPTATLRPTATKVAATPTPYPTQPIPPELTSAVVELDTPSLSERNAPPTAEPVPTITVPRPIPSEPVRLVIDAIGLDAWPIVVGLDENNVPIVPKHDVGWYTYSAEPGQGENIVFWGHVLRWQDSPNIPAPFANLKNAEIGSSLVVYTADGEAYEYVITDQIWATPDQVQYILPVGEERVTLVSCIGDKVIVNGNLEMSHRLITIAKPAN